MFARDALPALADTRILAALLALANTCRVFSLGAPAENIARSRGLARAIKKPIASGSAHEVRYLK